MQPCPPPHPAPAPPERFTPPAGSCDCHAHVFGPVERYPYAESRSYTPPDALPERYARLLETLGLARGVLVQPSVYGTDNRNVLDALAADPQRYRGVVVVGPELPEAELRRMHALGVRGVRFNVLSGGGLALDGLERMAARLAPLGWHLQLFVDLPALAELESRLAVLPVPVVVDHMGFVQAGMPLDDPGFLALLRLVEGGAWVKLSGAYRLTTQPLPYADVAPYARALVAANPERMIWGSDWPHPHYTAHPMPEDGALLDALADWTPDEPVRNAILAANPARLYDFPVP